MTHCEAARVLWYESAGRCVETGSCLMDDGCLVGKDVSRHGYGHSEIGRCANANATMTCSYCMPGSNEVFLKAFSNVLCFVLFPGS